MKTPQHFIRRGLLGAFVVLLSACTTQSGPTYTVRAVKTPGQSAPVFRVTCEGLVSSTRSCEAAAQKVCAGKPVTPVQAVDRVRRGAAMGDPRELTFMCGVPPQASVEPPVVAQPQPVVQQPVVASVAQRQVLLQGSANFAFDSAALTPSARQELNRFLDVNREARFRRVTVTGYTDSQGAHAHNVRLSEARARAVATYLRTGGLQAEHFATVGKGAAEPVASNATAEGRAQNRRVEIELETA
ncbi:MULTISPECIES: OmpA family protein [unclassified Burkholderia]|uniref:OmpA family protein n=1 Tax=unclassified Burkholderia TaxID=2613784 RepID=UPI001423FCEB|nr:MULTISPECIES: OmpA family protein [unclassified Burkholderia]NIE61141.1 OmpA family protein [Burkholderia sp. Ap-955]NIF13241.1 OmpA family protein [Burkholderia sp. Ax-1735]NIG07029.1 OmpA family protein [Burkholderia sp. Tr-849]